MSLLQIINGAFRRGTPPPPAPVYFDPESGDITFTDDHFQYSAPGYAKTGYTGRSPAGFVEFRTSLTDFSVKIGGGNISGFAGENKVFLLVDGVYNQEITLTSPGTQTVAITTLSAGVKLIRLVNGYAAAPDSTGDINLPEYVVAVQGVVTSGDIEIKIPVTPTKKILLIGMSITTGATGTRISDTSWAMQLRNDEGFNIQLDSYGGRSLADNAGNFIQAKADEMVAYHLAQLSGSSQKEIWMDLATNDFGNIQISKATYKTYLERYADTLHAANSSVRLIWIRPTDRTSYDTPNISSATLGDLDDAITEAASTRAWMEIMGDRYNLTLTNTTDGLHPNQAGHDEIKDNILAQYNTLTYPNNISAILTEDIARNWVRVEFDNSIGTTAPDASQFAITGKTVTEVVMRADKLLYLKVNSDFAMGATPTLSFTASGGLLGNLPTQAGVAIDNNITAATVMTWSTTDHFNDQSTDFAHNGKIIKVPAGTYGYLDIGMGEDITFVCGEDGPAHFDYCNFREAVLHCTIIGHPARTRTLKIHNVGGYLPGGGFFGIGCFATGNLRFENGEIYDVKQGIQVKTVSDLLFYPYDLSRTNYQNVIIRDFKIKNTSEEGLYIGSDVPAPLIPITWDISDIDFVDLGKDAVQVRNGSGEVKRITATKEDGDWSVGNIEDGINGHFLAFGTTSDGCVFEDCNAEDVFGNGLFSNGYGDVTLRRCTISSKGRTVTITNYGGEDNFSVGQTTVNFEGVNEFTCTDVTPYSLDARRDAVDAIGSGTDITLNIGPDTVFNGNTYVENMPVEAFGGGYRGGISLNYT